MMNYYKSHCCELLKGRKLASWTLVKGMLFIMSTFSPLFFMLSQNKSTKGQSKFMAGKFRKKNKENIFASQHGAPLWNSIFVASDFRAVVFTGIWFDLMPNNNAGCWLGEDQSNQILGFRASSAFCRGQEAVFFHFCRLPQNPRIQGCSHCLMKSQVPSMTSVSLTTFLTMAESLSPHRSS